MAFRTHREPGSDQRLSRLGHVHNLTPTRPRVFVEMYDYEEEPPSATVLLTAVQAKFIQGLLRQAEPHLPSRRQVAEALELLIPQGGSPV